MIKMMPLKQVCSGIIDCPHESPEWLSKGIPVIRNFNLVDGQIDMSDASYVDESTYTKRTRRAVPSAGDIIFSREAPIGNCAIVPADFKCCLGQRLVLLRVNRKICSPEYLLAALLSDFVKTQIFQVEKSGSIVSNFNISDLGDLIIPIIDRQESVASVSDTLNKKLLLNKNICAELEAMAKTLYDYWFTQFDFPNADGKPYRSSGGEMIWNDQLNREIPKGWRAGNLGDLGTITSGGTPSTGNDAYYTDKGIAWITPNDLSGNEHLMFFSHGERDVTQEGLKSSSAVLMPVGTVLFSSRAPIGYISIAENEVCSNQGFKSIVPNKGYGSYFVYYTVKTNTPAIAQQGVGTTFKEVSRDTMERFQIVLPPVDVATQFEDFLNASLEKRRILEHENRELTKLRDWLLPMLMNGQATVE